LPHRPRKQAAAPAPVEAAPVAPAPVAATGSKPATVADCATTIEGNDAMQYNADSITIPASCTQFTITLKHAGAMAVNVMGHNVVVAKEADMAGIAADGMSLTPEHVKPDDARIIAHTRMVGGGESASVTFDVVRWFHQLGSPPYFDRFAARWAPWCYRWLAACCRWAGPVAGAVRGAGRLPAGRQLPHPLHPRALAWMSMFVFGLMAFYAAIALIWRIKLCEILAMACAPIGAAFTVITLATGSIWGKPMWGTWWDWDPRLTTELILLFLYLGVIGLYHAIDDRRNAARAAGLLAIVGVALLPVIRYSVVWWNSLHQGQTIRMFGESSMDASMMPPLWRW
jgi:heme exporter protein C